MCIHIYEIYVYVCICVIQMYNVFKWCKKLSAYTHVDTYIYEIREILKKWGYNTKLMCILMASCGLQLVSVKLCECAFELVWSVGCNQFACVNHVFQTDVVLVRACVIVFEGQNRNHHTMPVHLQLSTYICTHTEKRVRWGMLDCAADRLDCRCCVCKTCTPL